MTASKSLPPRPSLDSLRKQARKLARERRVPLRDAQLALARQYGYPGWRDLTAEVSRRLGNQVEWAAAQARRMIHDNDVESLKRLLADYPALLSWRGGDWDSRGGVLGIATGSFGDSFDPSRERHYTRPACAELLLDAGAVVTPSVLDGLLESRARGLLELFRRRGLLPRTLRFLAALGDVDALRAALDEDAHDRQAVTDAFLCACHFEHEAAASLLLDRLIALDAGLGAHIASATDRVSFIRFLIERRTEIAHTPASDPWQLFVMGQVLHAIHARDLAAFVERLRREPWLLGEGGVEFQRQVIERATLHGREEFITALLDLNPALARRQPPPASQAIEFAFTYAHTHLLGLLSRIWPIPDDLPHAAGVGDLARVQAWFDASGAPALGDLDRHYPCNDTRARENLQWRSPAAQQVLDTALAFSVVNRHFEVADFLLAHGADINTDWSSHEPASILHELVFHGNYESMRFLIDRGIDMTITDHRWHATAQGWARYAAQDEAMAAWLEEAERERQRERS